MLDRTSLLATFLSNPAEVHALILGVHAGFEGEGDIIVALALGERSPATNGEADIQAQPWYASAGVLAGRLLARLDA